MRVLVCGGRDYSDYGKVNRTLRGLWLSPERDVIIYGGASGADRLAREWAEEHFIASQCFQADWTKHGKAAGPLRNQKMLDEGKPDLVVAFPGGNGTADMVRRAKQAGVPVMEIN